MLTISVNGHEQKLNIGCRTFVALDVLLGLLESTDKYVTLNGDAVQHREFSATMIKSGDALRLNVTKSDTKERLE